MTWSGRREGGSRFFVWLYGRIGVHLGRPVARLLLWPITIYFFLRRRGERVASRAFLSRAFGRRATFFEVMRHIYVYSSTILDRVFLLSGPIDRFDVRVHGLDELQALMRPDRGVLLLGAHIGSFEVLRSLGRERPGIEVRVVMDRRQTPVLTELLHELNPSVEAHIIDAGGDPAELALKMREAADRGMLIGLLSDRTRPGQATEAVEFFGENARFPTAPYLLASLLEVPVVLAFGLYRGGNRYDLHFETFAERIRIPREARATALREWAQRYAARLEHHTRTDPYNWFNLYDFWHDVPAGDAAVRRDAGIAAGHSA